MELYWQPSPYTRVFHAAWSCYEEAGWIYILERDGQYYSVEGGDYIDINGCDHHNTEYSWDDLEPITQEEALGRMLDWAEHEDEDYWLYPEHSPY